MSRRGKLALFNSIAHPCPARGNKDIGRNSDTAFAFETAARFGIVTAQLDHHVAQIFVIDAAHALQLVKGAFGDQIEIVDQLGHARVVTVGFLGLQHDAFGKVACADTSGIETLHFGQRLFHLGHADAQPVCHGQKIRTQIAGGFDLLDNLLRQKQQAARKAGSGLRHQMFAQADIGGGKAIEIGAFPVEAAGRVSTGQAQHAICAANAIGDAIMVEGFRAEIDVQCFRSGHIRAAQNIVAAAIAALGGGQCGKVIRWTFRLNLAGSGFEQRIALHLFGDERLDLHEDSASSLIACCNCGVITSDWLWRRSRRGASATG